MIRYEIADRPGEDLGTVWEEDAVRRVVDLASGYPYFLQLSASEAWIAAAGGPQIELDHVETAVPSVRRQLDAGLYSARFSRLSEREREYVEAMVVVADRYDAPRIDATHARVPSGAVAEHLGKTLSQLATTRDRVIRKGIVHAPRHGELAFSVPGFADYVRRRTGRA